MMDNSNLRETLKCLRSVRENTIQNLMILNDVIENLSLMIGEPNEDDWREVADKCDWKLGRLKLAGRLLRFSTETQPTGLNTGSKERE